MKTVRLPGAPLVESDGSFGHHKDTPRVLAESDGSFGHHKDTPETATVQVVNGVKVIVEPDARKAGR